MVLQTSRLLLRPAGEHDIEPLHRLWTEPGVRRFLWDNEVIPLDRARTVVLDSLQSWSARRYGLWTLAPSAGAPLVGFCGFRLAEWTEAPELLFGLSATHWGRGLALEAARAAVVYACDTLHAPRIVAATDPPNTASVKVLKRLGMRFERQGRLHGHDTVFFVLERLDLPLSADDRTGH